MPHSTKLKKILQNEKGITLVEVIASFVILVILLISFYTLFIQTAKTTKSSEDIVDATYIAQTEMEKIYKENESTGLSNETIINVLGYTLDDSSNNVFSKNNANSTIKLRTKNNINSNRLMNIIIEVKVGNITKAKMETVVNWKDNKL